MNSEKLASFLSQYGKIEKCAEENGRFHIKITEGFKSKAQETFKLIGEINNVIGETYPTIERLVTDNNLFEYIAKKKKEEQNGH